MQCPLFGSDVTHDSPMRRWMHSPTRIPVTRSQQQRIGVHIVGPTQFRLQPLIVFRGQRLWGGIRDEPGSLRG